MINSSLYRLKMVGTTIFQGMKFISFLVFNILYINCDIVFRSSHWTKQEPLQLSYPPSGEQWSTETSCYFQCVGYCSTFQNCRAILYSENSSLCLGYKTKTFTSILELGADNYVFITRVLCRQTYTEFHYNGKIECLKLHTSLKTQDDAVITCESEGAELVRIRNASEKSMVDAFTEDIGHYEPFYIDGSDRQTEGSFEFSSGFLMTSFFWHYPMNQTTSDADDCIVQTWIVNGTFWENVNCDTPHYFICSHTVNNYLESLNVY